MAKTKVKFPLDSIGGSIQGNDRTIGRDKGYAATIRDIDAATAGTGNNRPRSQLIALTAPTRGGSDARHDRAAIYCACDKFYSLLDVAKRAFIEPWWKAVSERRITSLSAHSIWMKICLKNLTEYDVFPRMSWCSRFSVTNNSALAWENRVVVFQDIPTYQIDGQDVEVYRLLAVTTVKNKITFDPRMIDYRLVHDVTERGKASVTIPALPPGASMLVDVYSYYRPVV